ncbi:MAG: signal peptidase II, partial [Desulfobacterales bacterium]
MRKKTGQLLIISGPVILLDQISKAVVLNTMRLYESIPVIPGFFNLTHIHNPGGAFGFMAGQSLVVRTILFLVVS